MLGFTSSCGSGGYSNEGSSGAPGYQPVGSNGELNGERNFKVLIEKASRGRVQNRPWAGYWWPYASNSLLDPVEKYVRARRGQDGSAVDWEFSHHGDGLAGIEDWWGHCNGWAAAAVLSPEPNRSRSEGGIAFSIGDQKALLSEIGMEVQGSFFGNRNNSGDPSSDAYRDVYPNQFFLALLSYVGQGFPLIMDRYTGVQVWNHPVAGYVIGDIEPSDYLGVHPEAQNIHRVMVDMRVWWLRNDVELDHQTEEFNFADGPSYESRVLRGEIWLDGPLEFNSSGELERSGNVVLARQGSVALGGAWRNDGLPLAQSHPDYLWVPTDYANSTGYRNPHISVDWVTKSFD